MEMIKRWYSKFIQCVVTRKLESHKEEIWFPNEIMEDILSRLPVKSILKFRSVSKSWLSLTSTPSFAKLQLPRAHSALFITAVDDSTRKKYFLSAPHDGGPVTHLMTVDLPRNSQIFTEAGYVNGLVSSFCTNSFIHFIEVFIVNPSTRKIFELPAPISGNGFGSQYYFGFDESINEHKILSKPCLGTNNIQIMIFHMSNSSWRKIDATDIGLNSSSFTITTPSCVCVNSIIHLLNISVVDYVAFQIDILAFDLRTEKFSVIRGPVEYVRGMGMHHTVEENKCMPMDPYLIKINGRIGVVCHARVVETNEMHIWILQDYENRVWVKETITFPEAWRVLGCPYPLDSVNIDEIIFSLRKSKLSRNVISAYIYNMKTGCFRSVQFTLDHPFLCSQTVKFSQIKCYVESLVPLPRNGTRI